MTAKPEEVRRSVAALIPDRDASEACPICEDIGSVHTEISQLYQEAKETQLDLILVDRRREDLSRAVVTRLRRHNGLTEVWRIDDDDYAAQDEPEYIDGVMARSLGRTQMLAKVDRILRAKQLLADYRIVGRSARMKMVAEMIDRVAATEMTVLVIGPSGAGKELVARAIHENSQRAEQPSVAINCGALSEGLLESELFGHEKGAFTGSVGKREGLFSKADGGTIFLDELGEMTQQMQVKLLRVLEDGTYYPVGSSTPRRSDVRVIAATNRDLTEAIAEGKFREDLYFRVAVVKVVLPPLMERKADIQPLLHYFWRDFPDLTYSDAALERLMDYDWPGNVRQLRNFADRMTALAGKGLVELPDVDQFLDEQYRTADHLPVATGKTIEQAGQELIYGAIMQLGQEVKLLRDLIISHLPESEPGTPMPGTTARESIESMDEMERDLIKRALTRFKGNRRETAEALGIGERTLYRKLKKYRLE